MREIKFRGKPIEDVNFEEINVHIGKDNFVYGNLIWNEGNPYIVGNVVEATDEYISLEQWISVRPETIGQYTGLTHNGIDIYEGDIVKITYSDNCIVKGEIEFSASAFQVCDESDCYELDMFYDIEVIGNIHENGDVLK